MICGDILCANININKCFSTVWTMFCFKSVLQRFILSVLIWHSDFDLFGEAPLSKSANINNCTCSEIVCVTSCRVSYQFKWSRSQWCVFLDWSFHKKHLYLGQCDANLWVFIHWFSPALLSCSFHVHSCVTFTLCFNAQ